MRSQQSYYLEQIARRDETKLSHVFGAIVERYATVVFLTPSRTPRKARRNFWLQPEPLALLGQLVAQQGLDKSEIARRLIDAAMADEFGTEG